MRVKDRAPRLRSGRHPARHGERHRMALRQIENQPADEDEGRQETEHHQGGNEDAWKRGLLWLARLVHSVLPGSTTARRKVPVLAITRLAVVHALFVPPLDANGAVVLLNVSFTAHPPPDRYRDDDATDAHPDHPRHDPDRR